MQRGPGADSSVLNGCEHGLHVVCPSGIGALLESQVDVGSGRHTARLSCCRFKPATSATTRTIPVTLTFGEVPLLLHNDQVLAQSNAILHYLAVHTGRWGGETPERLANALQWLFWEANRLGLSLPNVRFANKFDATGYPQGALTWLQERLQLDIQRLADEFKDGRMFILDDEPTIADFSFCDYLYWSDQAHLRVPTEVSTWLERNSGLPGWKEPYGLM